MSVIFIVEAMFDCTICNRQFKSQTGGKLHMKVKHGSKGKSCTTCNLLCHSKAELDRSPSLSFFSLTACLISKKIFKQILLMLIHVYYIVNRMTTD